MCGRMNISDHEGVQWLLESLGINMSPTQEPRYNIAPTLPLDVVVIDEDEPVLETMSWGCYAKILLVILKLFCKKCRFSTSNHQELYGVNCSHAYIGEYT